MYLYNVKCLPLKELCHTSETVVVNKNDIVDVIFVLSVDAVYKDPISFLGMSNLYYIRFQLTDRDIQSPINWISFRPLGLPSLLFFYISSLRDSMTVIKTQSPTFLCLKIFWKLFSPISPAQYLLKCRYMSAIGISS